ncbi:MAG: glycosyltransferase, partial [Gemmatimonadales bacterium]
MGHRAIIAGGGTGGHLYPALNLAEALKRLAGDGIEVLLVGAQRGVEARVLPERGLPYRLLPLEPIYRSRPWRNWRLLVSALRCGWDLHSLFESYRPGL